MIKYSITFISRWLHVIKAYSKLVRIQVIALSSYIHLISTFISRWLHVIKAYSKLARIQVIALSSYIHLISTFISRLLHVIKAYSKLAGIQVIALSSYICHRKIKIITSLVGITIIFFFVHYACTKIALITYGYFLICY